MIKYVTPLLLIVCLIKNNQVQGQDVLVPYKKGDRWGYADSTGTLKIAADYDQVEFCRYGRCKVFKNNLTGYIDEKGTPIIPVVYEECTPLMGHFLVRQAGKAGIVDGNGRAIVPLTFDKVEGLRDDFYQVTRNDASGVLKITTDGAETIVPVAFALIDYQWYNKRFFCTDKEGKVQSYDESGTLVNDPAPAEEEWTTIAEPGIDGTEIPERYTLFTRKGKQGLIISKQSRRLSNYNQIVRDTIPAKYDSIRPTERWNLILIMEKKKWGAINEEGQLMLEPLFDDVDTKMSFVDSEKSEQTFYAKKKGKWGLVHNKISVGGKRPESKVLIPFKYDSIRGHGRDYLVVKQGDFYGAMSRLTFHELTKLKYREISPEWIYTFTDFVVFSVKDEQGENVYVGENGVEFYSK